MSTNSQNTGNTQGVNTSPTPAEATAQINSAIASADNETTATVQNLLLVHQARLSQLTRTAATLKAKYGAADPRVVSAEAAVTARTTIVARVSAVSQQTTTPEPAVTANGWTLHGRVFDATLKPLASHTVFLVDNQKAYQEQIGFSYTDSTGYFLINNTPPAGQPPSTTSIYIAIVDSKAQPVYLSTTAFTPAIGVASYQNITLPAGEKPLGDPPAAIRNVAIPPKPAG